ncbi:hypothetical protein WISP_119667 [Willisornis vidua]|uniref:Uncharacterized protein n=1 Tax=Willisornis vidua TaxID=1566151 RepID=A0ABQ9CTS4_9PASS|nr:hypothetical protein WISP_119667 [Willisornis vidua]
MCDMIDSQSAEKISRMKKLRRTLSESFGRIALKKEDSSFDEVTATCPAEQVYAGRGVGLAVMTCHIVVNACLVLPSATIVGRRFTCESGLEQVAMNLQRDFMLLTGKAPIIYSGYHDKMNTSEEQHCMKRAVYKQTCIP